MCASHDWEYDQTKMSDRPWDLKCRACGLEVLFKQEIQVESGDVDPSDRGGTVLGGDTPVFVVPFPILG